MRYISLFSGIGGFECAIHSLFPNAECLGYSEIKPSALEVYKNRFPRHKNLGDITKIDEETLKTLGKCDLLVGGFPCTNLSSLAHIKGDSRGLKGESSKLFYDMLRIIKILLKKNPKLQFIIENNASMTKANRELITKELESVRTPVYMNKIDSAQLCVQTRKRLYWTTFEVNKPFKIIQTWKDVLEDTDCKELNPISDNYINCLNKLIPSKVLVKEKVLFNGTDFERLPHNDYSRSRWQCSFHSDTTKQKIPEYSYPVGKCRPITASFGNHNVLVDRRFEPLIIRLFTVRELERLFGYPDGYTSVLNARNKVIDCLGNSVVVFVIKYLLGCLEV